MRVFLAIVPDADVREAIAEWRAGPACPRQGWRLVPFDRIHLTLRFVGDLDGAEIDPWIDACAERAAACSGFRFEVAGVGAFPPRGRPRVMWAGVRADRPAGALERLAAALERACVEVGIPPETRSFRPHLTIARAKPRGPKPERPAPAEVAFGDVEVSEVVAFRSELRPDGAVYTVLDRFPLGTDPATEGVPTP